MKRRIFTLIGAAFMIAAVNGQITLTSKTHGFRIGDSHDFILMKNVDEGNAGADVIWDFTGLEASGRNLTSHMLGNDITEKTKAIPQSNFVLEEFGNHFIFNVSDDRMEQYGTVACNTVTVYDQPFLKLKFPFEFGNKLSGRYSGTQESGNLKTPVSGWYYIEADAYGTLLLPGNIEIDNVLRVKQTRTIDNINGSEVYELTYRWYADQVRYPVLVITKYVYPEQTSLVQTAMYAHVGTQKKSTAEIAEFEILSDLNVFPNPYEDRLTINYNLNKAARVRIELYDASGKLFRTVLNSVDQESGLKTMTLEGSETGLMPGLFYVRVTVDQNILIRRVVKL
jgi:hypothetical protein